MKKLSKLFSLGVFLLLSSLISQAQLKTILATITDSTGQIWANATIRIDFAPTPGRNPPFTWSGGAYATTINAVADINGYFSAQLAPNDQISPALSSWIFTICPNASNQCSNFNLPVTYGGSGDISSYVTANINSIGVAAIAIPRAYNDNQITPIPLPGGQYYNTTVKTPRFWDGSQFQSFLGSGAFNIFNSTYYNSDLYPGGNTCDRILAVDTKMGSAAGVISVNVPGTCSTAITLSPNHDVRFTAPVTFTQSITIQANGNNNISCTDKNISLTQSGTNALFILNDNSNLSSITNCHIVGNNSSTLAIHALGAISKSLVADNFFDGITPLQVEGGTNPNVDFVFLSNIVNCTPSPQGCGYGLVMYGINKRPVFSNNTITGGQGGVELYSVSGTNPYPTLAYILSLGSTGAVVSNNRCYNISQINAGACVFIDGMFGNVISNNTADTDGDVCFDAEISAYNTFIGNWATNCAIGAYSVFFASYGNKFTGNFGYSTGPAIFLLKNNSNTNGGNRGDLQSVDTILSNNTAICGGTSACPGVYMEPNHNTRLLGNNFTNAILAYNERNTGLEISNNTFNYTISLTGNPGLYANQEIFNLTTIVRNNSILSELTQAGSCIGFSNSDFAGHNQLIVENNNCRGWSGQVALTDTTTTNNQNVLIHNNHFDSITPTYTTTGTGVWTVTHNLNYTNTTTE